MLGDGICQPQCLTEACQLDKGDCEASLCGAGCYPHMQGDGLCQSECYSQACLWDLSDCDCSPGCKSTMLGNGYCDELCYTEACSWDLQDCGCAVGCRYVDLGHCKAECLVAACNYDSVALSDSSCLQTPWVFTCLYSCYIITGDSDNSLYCLAYLTCCGTSIPIQLPYCDLSDPMKTILPVNNRFLPDWTSEQQPMAYYVSSENSNSGSGSPNDPFRSLSQAIDQANLHYVDLLLAPGEYPFPGHHSLSTCYFANFDSSIPPVYLKQSLFPIKRLRIRSQDCVTTSPNCQRSVFRLNLNDYCIANFPQNMTIEIIDVVFVATIVEDVCSKGVAPCSTAWMVVPKGAVLSLVNVTFEDIGAIGGAGIMLMEGKLSLTNVDFDRLKPQTKGRVEYFGVITSNSSGEVEYWGGTVSLLNQIAYSALSSMIIEPFINLKSGSVRIEGVHFLQNTVAQTKALIQFETCFKCLISNCLFEYNLATIIYSHASNLPSFSTDWEEAQTIATSSLEIRDCVFRNNTGRNGASVVIRFANSLQRVLIKNCSFTNEYSETYGVVSITSSGYTPLARTGFWKYVYSDRVHKHNISFPAVSVAIEDSVFVNCTVGSFGLLHLAHLPRVSLSNITFTGHRNFGNVDVITNTYKAFPDWSGETPLFLFVTPLSTCLSIINITYIEEVVIAGMRYEGFNCSQGMYISNCTSGTLSALEVRENEGFLMIGAVMFLNFTELNMSGLNYYNNKNSHSLGQGSFSLLGNALIAHSRFEGNWATFGSALYLYSADSVTVSDSHFIGNAAVTGGAIGLELSPQQSARLNLKGSELRGNSAVDYGGAIAVMLWQGSASVVLSITSSKFLENNSTVGSVLHISALASLLQDSNLTDSYIAYNSASKDATFYLSSGYFLLVNTVFDRNKAQTGAAVYQSSSNAYLTFMNVSLLGNTAESIISLSSNNQKYIYVIRLLCNDNNGKCMMLEATSGKCESCLFSRNKAVSGAAFHLTNSSLALSNCQFEGNSVEAYGGAGFLEEASWLGCGNCSLTSNSAGKLGGALYVHSSFLSLSSSLFTFNSADSGFALELYRSSALSSITATAFMRNYGSGIGVLSLLSASLSLSGCSFEGNWGLRQTGGIHSYLSNLTITNCQFNDQIGYSGVFLYLSQSSEAYIKASNFSNGTALSSGGAATVIGSVVVFKDCQFRALSGQFGAAVFLHNSAELRIWDCELREITVTNTDRGVISGYRSVAQVHRCLFTMFTQSAISGQRMTSLDIANSSFTNATGNNGGAVFCMSCADLHIENSIFSDLRSKTGGALYLAGNATAEWRVSNSTFDSCISSDGGAVYAETSSVYIISCSFLNNTAAGNIGRGGALLLQAKAPVRAEILNSRFIGNKAGLKGGGICWEGTQFPPILTGNQYQGNAAKYGMDVASFSVNFTLKSAATLVNVASGQIASTSIELDLEDHYGQVVTIEASSFAQINSSNAAGTTRVPVSTGHFTFSDYSIISIPGLNTSLTITTTALATVITLPVQMRNCTVGEALLENECISCAANSYNLDAGFSCSECLEEAVCLGNFTMIPKSGYWRANNQTDRLFACPRAEACKGYPEVMNLTGECMDGYEGNKCATCSKGYFRWSRVRCSKCPSSSVHALGQLGLWAAVLLLLVLLILLNIQPSSSHHDSIYLKIFLNYLQLVMLFDSFHLTWPDAMLELFNAQEAVGGFPEYLFSFSCLYESESELQVYYRKWIVLSLLLPLLVLVSCLIWLCVAVCKRSVTAVRNQMIASGIVLFFMAYPSVLRALLGILHCEEILPGEYWVVGLELRCWQSSHLTYAFGMAVPCFIVWGIAVPAAILLVLIREKRKSSETEHSIRYGFLTTGYRTERYYWEYVVIYRKLLIIVFIVFFSQISLFLQVLSSLGVLLVSISLHSFLRPYTQSAFNSLELRSLLVATCTLYSGLFFYSQSIGNIGQIVIFAVISALNILFTLFCIVKIAYKGLETMVKKVKLLKDKQAQVKQAIAASENSFKPMEMRLES